MTFDPIAQWDSLTPHEKTILRYIQAIQDFTENNDPRLQETKDLFVAYTNRYPVTERLAEWINARCDDVVVENIADNPEEIQEGDQLDEKYARRSPSPPLRRYTNRKKGIKRPPPPPPSPPSGSETDSEEIESSDSPDEMPSCELDYNDDPEIYTTPLDKGKHQCCAKIPKLDAAGHKKQCTRNTSKYGPFCWQHTYKREHVQVRRSSIREAGLGLFAYGKNFAPGDYVSSYNGRAYEDEDEADEHYDADTSQKYLLDMEDQIIDARRTDSGNARYINSVPPRDPRLNCQFVTSDNPKERVVATKLVLDNEEFFLNYGIHYRDGKVKNADSGADPDWRSKKKGGKKKGGKKKGGKKKGGKKQAERKMSPMIVPQSIKDPKPHHDPTLLTPKTKFKDYKQITIDNKFDYDM